MAALRLARLQPKLLAPIELEIGAGELVFISGPSGAGKSLLLRAIADLDPSQGEVLIDAQPRSLIPAPEWRRRVGLLPAESGWWADQVGAHFAISPAEPAQASAMATPAGAAHPPVAPVARSSADPVARSSAATAAAVDATPTQGDSPDEAAQVEGDQLGITGLPRLLARLGFQPDVLDWDVQRLSTGERQRLALARLLINAPEVLLLDEATANLDPSNRAQAEQVIDDYRRHRRAAVLWASHDPDQRQRLAQAARGRCFTIDAGRLQPECSC